MKTLINQPASLIIFSIGFWNPPSFTEKILHGVNFFLKSYSSFIKEQ